MAVNEEGKFTKLTDDTVKKLEEVFALDGTNEEACFWAGISKQTFYNWVKDNPDMKERFDSLRQRPFLKARQTVISGIDGNPEFALKYLERKKKLEFGIQQSIDVTTKGESLNNITDEQAERILKRRIASLPASSSE